MSDDVNDNSKVGPDIAAMARRMMEHTPQGRALNIDLVSLEPGNAVVVAPWSENLIGDIDRNIVAGGVITTLLDHASGIAAVSSLPKVAAVATLDLRIDYLRPAKNGRAVNARAIARKTTRSVVFVQGHAFEDDEDDPVALASGAFAIRPVDPEIARQIREAFGKGDA